MLRSTKDLEKFAINASDGEIGRIKDFYFDDDAWTIRYVVVQAGPWLLSRKVLISPVSVEYPGWLPHAMALSINREQVRNSPDIDTDRPVSRQKEDQLLNYYAYPPYWGGSGIWGEELYPSGASRADSDQSRERMQRIREESEWRAERALHLHDDPHLRSCNSVSGYHIEASDGRIGHVSGYLIDDETWAISYLIANTSDWWVGHEVLIPPQWIKGVNWDERTVNVDLTRQALKDAPPYDSSFDGGRAQDLNLYQYYRQIGPWPSSVLLDDRKTSSI